MSFRDGQGETGGNGETVKNDQGVVICKNNSGVVKEAEETE